MKKSLIIVLLAALAIGTAVWWQHSPAARTPSSPAVSAGTAALAVAPPASLNRPKTNVVAGGNLPLPAAAAGTSQPPSREFDLSVNPYAAALREPGKSKRGWDADYIKTFQTAKGGDPVQFELTGGVMAEGSVKIIQAEGGQVSYVSGVLTAPETGKFFFLTPPVGGKAGSAVGVVEFPTSRTAYRVEPTGSGGAPELWQRRLDEVICMDMPAADPAKLQEAAQVATNLTENLVPLRPDMAPDYVPSYNSNIVSLQSYPGSPAVLLLDFAGGYTPTWGGVTYGRPPVDSGTIKDIWKRIAEDYMPFNINVTTDLKVFQAAAQGSRQRCCFTTTPVTAAGVAYEGSWNWGGDTPCWSVYYVGKPAAEVGAHEPGHTLGLSHETQEIPDGSGGYTHNEYFTGQGGGVTGWAPIMGAAYYQNVTTWSHGEYQYAGNLQDQLNIIATGNNNVTYRVDDTGSTLATSRYLEVYTNYTVFAQGVIERTADTDAFQFTTTGGTVSLTANPVGDWADLGIMASLADATDTIIATNNPQSVLTASITTNLPAGTYTFRVTGAGRNDPLTSGFSSYSSLGYYSITGSVAGARMPTRLTVAEHATNNTVVGPVTAINPNSSPLVYSIASGNTGGTFSVDNNGVVTVANNALLDYYTLATNWNSYAAQFEVFMNITNVNNPALTELNRRVVIAVQQLYPPMPTAFTATLDSSLRVDLAWNPSYGAISYNLKRSTIHGGPYTTLANLTSASYTDGGLTNGVTYYYVVSAVNANGESYNSAEASVLVRSVAGGFESPSLGAGNYQYNPTGGGGWTFVGASPNGSGIVANGSGFSNPNAPEGVQAAFVQSYGTISQTFTGFTPGTNYQISYQAAQRSGYSETWTVKIDNTVIQNNAAGSTSYNVYTVNFTATANTHTLSFVGTDLAGNQDTVFIDNVQISPALQPVAAAVTVTSPTNNTVFSAFAPVNLTASVTTNGNVINGVQFYADNMFLGQTTNAPYVCALANVTGGSHSLVARVLFNNGSVADSIPVNIVVANGNLNLGFETPSVGSGNYVFVPSGASWTFSGFTGDGAGIAANGSGYSNPNAPQGTQAALLQEYGTITQTLTGFAPGTNYTITYSAAERAAQSGGQTWNVAIDNTVISSNNPGAGATSYTTYTANFTATSAAHTLAFVGTDLNGGDNTVFIDNVIITPPLATIATPYVATNTLPAAAADVVGSQVAFKAAFTSTNAMTYQWQKIAGGVLNNIAGATNTTLTLTNLQLSDTALYRLQASNVLGVAVSTASPLTVSSVPAAVTNVIIDCAAQTGLGSAGVNFYTTWTVTPGSLIAGQSPSSVGSGGFGNGVAVLTDGSAGWSTYGTGSATASQVTCGSGAGQSVTYTLSGSTNGYNLTNIMVYGGWCDAGRDQQAYTVYYATISNPTGFFPLASVSYNPVNDAGIQSATRVTLLPASGALASNVVALMFDFTTPPPENGYCGYSEIQVFGSAASPLPAPLVLTNTLPATAADVVGSQVTFTAAFSSSSPMTFQWQKLTNGVPSNITGATNMTLTLTNLQLSDTASYRLQASNVFGTSTTTASPLTVSSLPAAVTNVIIACAAQTGLGSVVTKFTPTWVVASGSLIAGQSPSSVGSGSFNLDGPGTVTVLTDGGAGWSIYGTGSATASQVTGGGSGAGQSVTYTVGSSTNGYTLANVVVYGGWCDAGRDSQAYTVYYSTVSTPTAFIPLGSVSYNPANPIPVQSATRVTLLPASGALATNVAAVKIDFTTPAGENGYEGYSEIQLFGSAAPAPIAPVLVTDINPTNATDVVGGQQVFTAAFNGFTQPLSYQWLVNTGSGPVPVPGATSLTLTLGNLQLTNTGAYSLQASNAAGVSVSSSATLVVNPAPVPDANGIVIIPANQAGPSPFTPTWTVVQSNSLIYGSVPTTSSGTFDLNGPRAGVNGLTTNIYLTVSDVGGVQDPNYVATCGNGYSSGSQIIYTLTNSGSGYNLTNITVYSGWDDNGRNAQAYAVYYATAANPTNFIYMTAVNYTPSVAGNPPMANQVVISNASGGLIAANVYALEFLFSSPPSTGVPNGYSGYAAITVGGAAAAGVVATNLLVTSSSYQSGTSPFTPSWTAETASLIHGQAPSTATGTFTDSGCGGTPVLTDGAIGHSGTISAFASCGYNDGTTLIYALTNGASGSDVTNIVVYSGWGDTGRYGQYYYLSYSTIAAPSVFIPLTTVFYWPGLLNGGAPAEACRVAIARLDGSALADGVAKIKFDFASPPNAAGFNNAWQGYSEIIVQGKNTATPAPPALVQNTLPSYAETVVGDQVVFTSAFSNSSPVNLQWLFISGAVTNVLAAQTNTTLTLNNVQLTNSGSYLLEAINATNSGLASYSSAAPLVVGSVPAAVNNVILEYAGQCGLGAAGGSSTNFYPTWTVNTNNDLIKGFLTNGTPGVPGTVYAGTGNFDMNVTAYGAGPGPCNLNPSVLSDGSGGSVTYWVNVGGNNTECSCGTGGAGDTMTYTLPNSSSNGFNLTNITVYGGWGDTGRNEQKYQVLYATVANPTTFISLGTYDYNPTDANNVQSATRTMLIPASGVLASNVSAMEINWNVSSAPKNSWEGYSEIIVQGTATQAVATNPTNLIYQVTGGTLTLSWPVDHTGWHLQVQTNSPAQGLGTNWFNVAGSTATNQVAIPINPANGSVFYRMTYP